MNYNRFFYQAMAAYAATSTGTWRMMLLTSSYTPDKDHDYVSTARSFEVTGTGYTTDGPACAWTATLDDANDRVDMNTPQIDIPTSNITARYGLVWLNTAGADTTDPLGFVIDFGGNITSTGGTFSIPAMTTPVRIQN